MTIIQELRKTINELNKKINKQDTQINKLLEERFLFLKSAPKENQKPFIECGQSQQYKIRKDLSDSIEKINESNYSLRKYKLKVKCVVFVHEEIFDHKDCRVKLKEDEEKHKLGIDNYLYIKDRFNIGDRVWTALKIYLFLDIPSVYALTKRRNELNQQFTIIETEKGYYCDPVRKMREKLTYIFQKKLHIFQDKVIIKIQLDGFVIHRLNYLLNFSFSIVNEGTKSTTALGTYLIGLFKIQKECYDEIKPIVTKIWGKLQTMDTFTFGEITYPIEFKSCSDHKMQALVISE